MAAIILFDGFCNLCSATMKRVMKEDSRNYFRFATLQSEQGKALLEKFGLQSPGTDSFVLIENNRAYIRSEAALRVFQKLSWYWQWIRLGWILPKSWRDGVYDFISRNRYRWFGKKNQCLVPGEKERERFIDQ